jgi:2-oxoacid dehydrogenases acyltransferase (catalytic domain)/Type II CAAX prenyl endopeptidase Rce1-like
MPTTLLQFAVAEEGGEPISSGTFLVFLVIALAFNGVAGPITEELYFRGHLLPRLERYGRWAPGHQHQLRDLLNLTVAFDRDVVEGAPAARFVHRLVELIESPDGLDAAMQDASA